MLALCSYVTYADHDDTIEFDIYEKMYAVMQKYHPEVVMCANDYMVNTQKDRI